MSDYLTQIKKIDRFLADPSITWGERAAAENRRRQIIMNATEQAYADRVKQADAKSRTRPNVSPKDGGRQSARQAHNQGSPRYQNRTVAYGTPKDTLTGRLRGNPTTAPSAFQAVFGALALGDNIREGWERGNAGPLGNPVSGAVDAFTEAAGGFVPAFSIGEFVGEGIANLGGGLLNLAGFNPNPPAGAIDTTAGGTVFSEQGGALLIDGGQAAGVAYTYRVRRIYIATGGPGCNSWNAGGVHYTFPEDQGKSHEVTFGGRSFGTGPLGVETFDLGCGEARDIPFDIERVDGQPDDSGQVFEGGQVPSLTYPPGYVSSNPPTSNPSRPPPIPNFSQEPGSTGAPEAAPPPAQEVEPGFPLPEIPSSIPFVPPIPGNAGIYKPSPSETASGRKPIPPNSPSCSPCFTGINQKVGNLTDSIKDQLSNLPNLANLGLVATILDIVNGISSAIGVSAFPINVPQTINAKASTTTTLNNLTELHEWNARNLDSVMGHWPNAMNTEDGNFLEFDTVNDQLNELLGLNMAIALNVGINQQLGTKGLVEMQGIKQEAQLSKAYAQGNAEYLGYRQKQSAVTVPTSVTNFADNITSFLSPSTQKMMSVENVDDEDINSCLRTLCEAAAIIIARFKRPVNRNIPTEDIRARIEQAKKVGNNTFTYGNQQVVDDFADFVRQVEEGFGVADAYGRQSNERPNIQDLSN